MKTEKRDVPRADVVPGPNARSGVGDQDSFRELVESIRENGILVPLLVRPVNGGLEIVAGFRRYRAAEELELAELPVLVAELEEHEARAVAAIDNLQREDLTVLEEAEAFRQLRDEVGMAPPAIAARTGFPVARIGNVLRVLELPEDLRPEVDDRTPLDGLKWVLKVPAAAADARKTVLRLVNDGRPGKDAFFRVGEVIEPADSDFVARAPTCVGCAKALEYQVPPSAMDRWRWRGETGKDWPTAPVCFDRVCRGKKRSAGERTSKDRNAAVRRLPKLVREALADAEGEHGAGVVVNTYEDLRKWRRGRMQSWMHEAPWPEYPRERDAKGLPKGLAWPLNGVVGRDPGDDEMVELRAKCLECRHRRIGVDGFVTPANAPRVVLRECCASPATRQKELAAIRKEIEAKRAAAEERERREITKKGLPKLERTAGAKVVGEVLVRRLARLGAGLAIAEALLAGDDRGLELLEEVGNQVGEFDGDTREKKAELRMIVRDRAEALWSRNPRRLALLFALPELEDHVYNFDRLGEVVRRRLQLVGKEADPLRLERFEKATLAEARGLLESMTRDECEILLERLADMRGAKGKATAIRARIRSITKESIDA